MIQVPIKSIQLDAPVLSVAHSTISKSKREYCSKCFDAIKHLLQGYVTEGSIAYGWKQEESEDTDEFVIFAPWKEVAQHLAYAEGEGYDQVLKITEFVAEANTKYVMVLEI